MLPLVDVKYISLNLYWSVQSSIFNHVRLLGPFSAQLNAVNYRCASHLWLKLASAQAGCGGSRGLLCCSLGKPQSFTYLTSTSRN